MGNPLQEVFQGRGDKKGQGFWIKRSIPLFLIVSTWLGLLIDLPVKKTLPWFFLGASTVLTYSLLHFTHKRREFSIEFLFSLALINAGIIHAMKLYWLKLAYFPFVISMTAFYSLGTIIPLSLLIPFLELQTFISMENLVEETAFSAFLILTAVISSVIFTSLKKEKEKAVSSLRVIKENARDISQETGMESLSDDKVISHYFASMLKTDEEIRELLITLKQTVFADSANFFTPQSDSVALRCSTDEKGDIIITGKGLIMMCMKDKKPFFTADPDEKRMDAGYIKNGKISSVIAVPVMDGSTPVGVLTVDSPRFQAFSEPDKSIVQMFAGHLVRILERERIYPRFKRNFNGLKILHEESSKLVASLNIDVIVERLCEGAGKFASSDVFCFISRGKDFELIHHAGAIEENNKLFDLKGTLLNMAVENKQPLYISDIKSYRIPILPFKTENVHSIIALPIFYENNALCILVMLSRQKEFLDAFQLELLKVLCNQASTSIANAKLHAEIEKMATTDGLTGLFNHRLFQEKLSEELKRLNRFSGPTSLLLTDIDYFKRINDTYGHPVGDLVLGDIAKVLRETIRDIDIPARYGGEEFAAILPGTDSEGAKRIAERLRKAVMSTSFTSDGRSFNVTLSIGIATSPSDARSKEELIEKADQALYHAKHNGRNQSVLWSSIK
ncbi:MAG: sensor domain-containing diguanylate cyclase [Nitrospirota bacterium]